MGHFQRPPFGPLAQLRDTLLWGTYFLTLGPTCTREVAAKVYRFPEYEMKYDICCTLWDKITCWHLTWLKHLTLLTHTPGWHPTQMVQGRHVIRAAPFQLLANTGVQMSGMSRCKPITWKLIRILCTLPSSSWWHLVTRVTLGNRVERVTWQTLLWRTWQNDLRRIFKMRRRSQCIISCEYVIPICLN